jgi:hypothetical protein
MSLLVTFIRLRLDFLRLLCALGFGALFVFRSWIEVDHDGIWCHLLPACLSQEFGEYLLRTSYLSALSHPISIWIHSMPPNTYSRERVHISKSFLHILQSIIPISVIGTEKSKNYGSEIPALLACPWIVSSHRVLHHST